MTPGWRTTKLSYRCRWLHTVMGLSLLASLLVAQDSQPQEVSECVRCHQEKTAAVYKKHATGVHAIPSVGCVGCHGGDPRAKTKRGGHDPKKGYVGVGSPGDASARCASCHEDATKTESARLDKSLVERWRRNAHGRSVAEGGPRPATCMSCHGWHGILSHEDPQSPTHPTQVPSTCGRCHERDRGHMAASPHHAALQHTGMPSCVRCHDNHGTEIPLFSATCEECHKSEADPAHEVVQRMAVLIERADKQIEALDRVIANLGEGQRSQTKARLLAAEQERVRGLRKRVRQASHSLDVGFLAAAVSRLEHGVQTVTAVAAADLDGNNGFDDSTVALLLTAGVVLLLLLSIVFSVFMFRLVERIKKRRSNRVVQVTS